MRLRREDRDHLKGLTGLHSHSQASFDEGCCRTDARPGACGVAYHFPIFDNVQHASDCLGMRQDLLGLVIVSLDLKLVVSNCMGLLTGFCC